MKRQHLIAILLLISSQIISAQLLDALKKRAQERGMETREVSYDSAAYDPNALDYDEEKEINSVYDFFTNDVVMKLYNEGTLMQTAYFDKETIAMRTDSKANPKPIYHDRKGKFYAFNEKLNQYESVSLLPASSMGFMMAGMIPQFYKLPQSPYLNAFEALAKMDIAINFYVLELAFIYEPKHFEDTDAYTKSITRCASGSCTKFSYNDPEYSGSYILFDTMGKLREFYIKTDVKQPSGDNKNQTGKFVFSYKPVDVTLPEAVEQSLVPGPLGKLIPLEKGLEPWKYNKADKQKN